ncbi:4156_t:CDS:2, partial [Ambispora gerdemannii]
TATECLYYQPKFLRWAGKDPHFINILHGALHSEPELPTDLFNDVDSSGKQHMIIIETNSTSAGLCQMPAVWSIDPMGIYKSVIESAFNDILEKADPLLGGLAVVHYTNVMESSGYAAALAEVAKEKVWLVTWKFDDPNPPLKWLHQILYIRDANGEWHSIRACFRMGMKTPWIVYPLITRTLVMNPVVTCLAGGRNKMMASRAYELFNEELSGSGLTVKYPKTLCNLKKAEIPTQIKQMGGHAVIKSPYSSVGSGVYTITNSKELQNFLDEKHHYDNFLLQSLVGNISWYKTLQPEQYYITGSNPGVFEDNYLIDFRMVLSGCKKGFRPVCVYARRARTPLVEDYRDLSALNSWDMLGITLTVPDSTGKLIKEIDRLIPLDKKTFDQAKIDIDDLVDAYVQSFLATIAIDKMSSRLIRDDKEFNYALFKEMNPDPMLLREIDSSSKS